ncbi:MULTISPECIES: hypothetical protein [unclassified Cryobacterium]|nr:MULTISPECIES: hypothetical protein [unclassified Cryobacterium]
MSAEVDPASIELPPTYSIDVTPFFVMEFDKALARTSVDVQ